MYDSSKPPLIWRVVDALLTMTGCLGIEHPSSAAANHINSADWAICESIENITKFSAG